jgi:hypothetical protein
VAGSGHHLAVTDIPPETGRVVVIFRGDRQTGIHVDGNEDTVELLRRALREIERHIEMEERGETPWRTADLEMRRESSSESDDTTG